MSDSKYGESRNPWVPQGSARWQRSSRKMTTFPPSCGGSCSGSAANETLVSSLFLGSISLSSNWEAFVSSRSPLSIPSALTLCNSMTLTSSTEKEPLALRTPSLWFPHGGHISIVERILTPQLTFKIHWEGEMKWKHTRWNVSSLLFQNLDISTRCWHKGKIKYHLECYLQFSKWQQ